MFVFSSLLWCQLQLVMSFFDTYSSMVNGVLVKEKFPLCSVSFEHQAHSDWMKSQFESIRILLLRFVFITSARRWGFAVELEPSSLALPDFTVAASSPPDTSPCLPLLSTMPSFVKLSSLTFRIPRLALCSLFSAPPPLPRSHSSLVGLGALGDGLWGLAIQNANQALGGTSHDFPPRHGLLFCY